MRRQAKAFKRHYAFDHIKAVRERGYSNIWNGTQTQVVTKSCLLFLFILLHKKFIRIEKLNK